MSRSPVWKYIDIEYFSAIEAEQITSLYDALSETPVNYTTLRQILESVERDDEHFYYDICGIIEALEKS